MALLPPPRITVARVTIVRQALFCRHHVLSEPIQLTSTTKFKAIARSVLLDSTATTEDSPRLKLIARLGTIVLQAQTQLTQKAVRKVTFALQDQRPQLNAWKALTNLTRFKRLALTAKQGFTVLTKA